MHLLVAFVIANELCHRLQKLCHRIACALKVDTPGDLALLIVGGLGLPWWTSEWLPPLDLLPPCSPSVGVVGWHFLIVGGPRGIDAWPSTVMTATAAVCHELLARVCSLVERARWSAILSCMRPDSQFFYGMFIAFRGTGNRPLHAPGDLVLPSSGGLGPPWWCAAFPTVPSVFSAGCPVFPGLTTSMLPSLGGGWCAPPGTCTYLSLVGWLRDTHALPSAVVTSPKDVCHDPLPRVPFMGEGAYWFGISSYMRPVSPVTVGTGAVFLVNTCRRLCTPGDNVFVMVGGHGLPWCLAALCHCFVMAARLLPFLHAPSNDVRTRPGMLPFDCNPAPLTLRVLGALPGLHVLSKEGGTCCPMRGSVSLIIGDLGLLGANSLCSLVGGLRGLRACLSTVWRPPLPNVTRCLRLPALRA